jgi:hypothetical protein
VNCKTISESYNVGLASETINIFFNDDNTYALAEGVLEKGLLYSKSSISGESDQVKVLPVHPDPAAKYPHAPEQSVR